MVRQQRAAHGRERHHGNTKLGAGLHQPKVGRARGERIFRLNGRDRKHLHGAPQGRRRDFRQADGAGLALFNQPAEIGRRFFRREARVAAMGVEQVHALHAKPLQRLVQLGFKVLRRIVEAAVAVRIGGDRGLCRDHEFVPRTRIGFQIAAEGAFRFAHAVDIGRIQMRDTQIAAGIQNGVAFRFVRRPVHVGEGHRPIADGTHFRPVGTQSALFHVSPLCAGKAEEFFS